MNFDTFTVRKSIFSQHIQVRFLTHSFISQNGKLVVHHVLGLLHFVPVPIYAVAECISKYS